MVADRLVLSASARIRSVFAIVPINRFVAESFTTGSRSPSYCLKRSSASVRDASGRMTGTESYRPAIVGAFRQARFDHHRVPRRDKHSLLRRNGAKDPLVAVQRLPHDLVHALVHYSRRIWHRTRVGITCANTAARFLPRGGCRRSHWRNLDFCLLRGSVSDYRLAHQVSLMFSLRIVALFVAILSWASLARGSVPIIVNTPSHQRAVMDLCSKASEQLKNGDVAGAKHNVDRALSIDPKLWPALYLRAQIFKKEGKYELAIQDCNEALRQYRGLVEASLLRASINVRLGKYAEALKEFNYLISLHPRPVTLARALSDRAWFYATCPDSSFRNGKQAVKDAKAACSMMQWKDEDMIDTLAAAYAEAGDFDSAVQYVSQALAVKGISSDGAKAFREHLAWFQQRKRVPVSR